MRTDELAGALGELSLHSLLILTSRALSHAGWQETAIMGRRQSGQKSERGGHEILCLTTLGPTAVRMLVKVVRDDARTRMLDELAGAVLREKADLGLLVTPFKVSASVAARQALYRPARVETMDGKALADLMGCSGIAVRPDGSPDYAFLSALEDFAGRVTAFAGKERR